MADRSRLPDKKLLDKLYYKIIGPEDEMDEVSTGALLEDYGLTPEDAVADVRKGLEQKIQELRAEGADVPQVLLDAVAGLQPKEEGIGEDTVLDPETWIRDLLAGRMPENVLGSGQAQHLHAFRGLSEENLSEEDRQILERLAVELEAENEQEEG